jgi:ribosomal protein L17
LKKAHYRFKSRIKRRRLGVDMLPYYDNCAPVGGEIELIAGSRRRHGDVFSKLNRNPQDRMRLLRTLSSHLFEHERIETTLPRAKELSRYAEKTITKAKRAISDDSRLRVFERVIRPETGTKVLTVLKERYQDRPGGYTRVYKAGFRQGDRAPMAVIELVDQPRELKKFLDLKAKVVDC